eukprot:m.49391 g.49391  ORF g.49391 m.49391 type:complete len:186 (+) comp12074_c0_seq1:139-696(+)
MMRFERVAGFSDAVFAIAATIKIIPLKLEFPIEQLDEELKDHVFDVVAYFASFYLIVSLWHEHAMLFDRLKKVDDIVVWLNLWILLLISFVPFSCSVFGRFYHDPDAILLNLLVFGGVAFVQILLLLYVPWIGTMISSRLQRAPLNPQFSAAANKVGLMRSVFTFSGTQDASKRCYTSSCNNIPS